MIIKEIKPIGKAERLISQFIDIGIIVLVLAALVLVDQYYQTQSITFMLLKYILGVGLCSVSFFELHKLYKVSSSITLSAVRKAKVKIFSTDNYLAKLKPNEYQTMVLNSFLSSESLPSTMYIHGIRGIGKTTSTFLLMYKVLEKKAAIFAKTNNVIFIDCRTNKNEIVNFFRDELKLDDVKGCILIIDNIEMLGDYFIKIYKETFQSNLNNFILVHDTGKYNLAHFGLKNESKEFAFKYSKVVQTKAKFQDIEEFLNYLDEDEKTIVFAVIVLAIMNDYISLNYIKLILSIKISIIKKVVKKAAKLDLILNFPFTNDYIILTNDRKLIRQIINTYNFTNVAEMIINSESTSEFDKWSAFLYSDSSYIDTHLEYFQSLFSKILSSGRYKEVYSCIMTVIDINPRLRSLFIYELAVLKYYMGYHTESVSLFKEKLSENNLSNRSEIILQIVKGVHGSNNSDVKNMIQIYINELKSRTDIYKFYGMYWETHMDTERGIFNWSLFAEIRENIQNDSDSDHFLATEMIRRCYTDELRCLHILGILPSTNLESEFMEFLSSHGDNNFDYYYNLYVKANTLHYVEIPNNILNCESLIEKAQYYYNLALNSSLTEEKSRKATRLKLKELDLIYFDCNIIDVEKYVDDFFVYADINNIDVFKAYSLTYKAKIKMLYENIVSNTYGIRADIELIEEIKICLNKSKEIYSDFGNQYGVFRVDFLRLLFQLVTTTDNEERLISEILDLCNENSNYEKEKEIAVRILSAKSRNEGIRALVIHSIRTYPIILQ